MRIINLTELFVDKLFCKIQQHKSSSNVCSIVAGSQTTISFHGMCFGRNTTIDVN